MFDCWAEIRILQGRTLHTLDQRKAFDVVEVSADDVTVRLHVNRKIHKIERWEIEEACWELLATGQITRSRIQKAYADYHSALVAAMLAEFSEVSFTLRPITLYYRRT